MPFESINYIKNNNKNSYEKIKENENKYKPTVVIIY